MRAGRRERFGWSAGRGRGRGPNSAIRAAAESAVQRVGAPGRHLQRRRPNRHVYALSERVDALPAVESDELPLARDRASSERGSRYPSPARAATVRPAQPCESDTGAACRAAALARDFRSCDRRSRSCDLEGLPVVCVIWEATGRFRSGLAGRLATYRSASGLTVLFRGCRGPRQYPRAIVLVHCMPRS